MYTLHTQKAFNAADLRLIECLLLSLYLLVHTAG